MDRPPTPRRSTTAVDWSPTGSCWPVSPSPTGRPEVRRDGVVIAVLVRRRDRALLTKDATIREIHHRVKNNLQANGRGLPRRQADTVAPRTPRPAREHARTGLVAIGVAAWRPVVPLVRRSGPECEPDAA